MSGVVAVGDARDVRWTGWVEWIVETAKGLTRARGERGGTGERRRRRSLKRE